MPGGTSIVSVNRWKPTNASKTLRHTSLSVSISVSKPLLLSHLKLRRPETSKLPWGLYLSDLPQYTCTKICLPCIAAAIAGLIWAV